MTILSVLSAMCLALPVLAEPTAAEKLIEQGHWKQARKLVEDRLRLAPNDALATFLLSQIRHAFGDDATPRALAEKAIALDGQVAKYHRQLAEVLGVEAQHAGPLRLVVLAHQFRNEIDTALSLDPRDLQAQRDLMEYYLLAPAIAGGTLQKAVMTAQRIAELDAAEGFLAKARIASAQKRPAETEALLRLAAQSQTPSYRVEAELARFYLAKEHSNPAGAEIFAKDLLKLDRGRVEPYSILAQIYAERADWRALDSLLIDASRECPDDLAPYYNAAVALLANGRDSDRAARYLHVYLEHEPEGNEPSLADARRKVALVESRRPV